MSLWNNAIKSLLKMKHPHPKILNFFLKKIDEVQYLKNIIRVLFLLINPDFLENDKLCFLSKITGIGEIRAHLFKNVFSHPFISQNQILRTQS